MHHRLYRSSETSRYAFHNLVALWLFIFLLAFAVTLAFSARDAKADIVLPLPKVQKVFEPAVLQSFTPSPSPALVEERCNTYLHPLQTGSVSSIPSSSRTQRNADPREKQTISAIKAYRHCVSQIVLGQLANK